MLLIRSILHLYHLSSSSTYYSIILHTYIVHPFSHLVTLELASQGLVELVGSDKCIM